MHDGPRLSSMWCWASKLVLPTFHGNQGSTLIFCTTVTFNHNNLWFGNTQWYVWGSWSKVFSFPWFSISKHLQLFSKSSLLAFLERDAALVQWSREAGGSAWKTCTWARSSCQEGCSKGCSEEGTRSVLCSSWPLSGSLKFFFSFLNNLFLLYYFHPERTLNCKFNL